jgi:parvulin-like peptidyl-prolyl isomerase
MLAATLLLQTSGIVAPLYLGEDIPDTRAVRAILVVHRDVPGAPHTITRSKEEALEFALGLVDELQSGADFGALAFEHSGHRSAKFGGVLGSFWPGMLRGATDEFLFAAQVGKISDPIETDIGYQILQRIEAEAGCLQIFVDGTGDEARHKMDDLQARLKAGADFAALARSESEDPESAARGGQLAIFRRGPRDTLIKAAAFEAQVGEVVGPIETPYGLHLIKRVPPGNVDPALYDDVIARVRAISILTSVDRPQAQAEELIRELHARLTEDGADMAALAREWDEDEGGAERAGDLGWILRDASRTRNFMNWVFLEPKGEYLGPYADKDRWVLLFRER